MNWTRSGALIGVFLVLACEFHSLSQTEADKLRAHSKDDVFDQLEN